jgi:hypothetical protein
MLECGPVVFQANDEAEITGVRAQDFDVSFADSELRRRGWQLQSALEYTIDDIFWSSSNSDEVMQLTDTAISKFHSAFMLWLDEYYNQFESRETATPPREIRNKIQAALNQLDITTLTAKTSLIDTDVDCLKSGKVLPFESRAKLADLPEDFVKCHNEERRKSIEGLCNEIRASGFSQAEKERFSALLGLSEKPDNNIKPFFEELRTKLFK